MSIDAWWRRLTAQLGSWNSSELGRVSVYVSSSGVALARGKGGETEAFQVEMRSDPIAQLANLRETLAAQIKALGLSAQDRRGCNLVLAPELYTISLIDRPDVPDEDVRDAARWALQEQLEYPVEEATLDVFELPRGASREHPMLFVAAIQTEFLRNLIEEVGAAGLSLARIDITDLALRNIAWRCFPQPDLGVALLRLSANNGLFNVSRGDEVYLSRRISGVPRDFTESDWEDFRERFVVQVQRSIDYYESSMGQPPCNILLVACCEDWTERVTDYLSEMLAMPVRKVTDVLPAAFDLTLFDPEKMQVEWGDLDERFLSAVAAGLPAIGGALRSEIESSQEVA